jgi:lambda family phage tail tape measure protein
VNRELDFETGLLRLEKGAREDAARVRDVENQLRDKGIQLAEAERSALSQKITTLRELNEATERQNNLLKELRGPQQEYQNGVLTLNQLLADGRITAQEYADKLRDMQLDALESNKDMVSGMQRGLMKMQRDFDDFAGSAERGVVRAFQSMEDSLVSFVTTGKFGIGDLVNTILAELARLAVRQAVVAPLMNAFSGILGTAAGSLFGSSQVSYLPGGGYPVTPVERVPLNHAGGIVGAGNEASGFRDLTPGTFRNAARYHTGGIAGHEVPTVLTRGEGVFTPGQMAALGAGLGGAKVSVTVVNNAPNAEVKTREVSDGRGGVNIELMIEEVVARSVRQPGGAVNRAVRDTFPNTTQRMAQR